MHGVWIADDTLSLFDINYLLKFKEEPTSKWKNEIVKFSAN